MSNRWTGVKDSGARQEFETGSRRDTREGKGRFDLLPTRALRELALHFEHGAVKYGDRNWERGQPMSRYIDSALRHLMGVLEGRVDENHLAAAAWNIMCCMDTRTRIEEGLLPAALGDLSTLDAPVECAGQQLPPDTNTDTPLVPTIPTRWSTEPGKSGTPTVTTQPPGTIWTEGMFQRIPSSAMDYPESFWTTCYRHTDEDAEAGSK